MLFNVLRSYYYFNLKLSENVTDWLAKCDKLGSSTPGLYK